MNRHDRRQGRLVRPAGLHHCLLADPPNLQLDLSFAQPTGETIRLLLLGSPGGIHQTRHLLHNLGEPVESAARDSESQFGDFSS